jgi:hypothetical protein
VSASENLGAFQGTPRHHRDEDQTRLELASYLSDPHEAHILRTAAERHIVQATELEKTARAWVPQPHFQHLAARY